MNGTVTVYFNTGFNGIDIPASPSVLSNASSQSYNDVYYVREDIDKPAIRIKDSYENLRDVDYCAINTSNGTSYFFAVPTALTKGVTLLTLELDALLTMGGAPNLDYISGWQERGHIAKSDDVLFSNIASEDWVPTQPLETSGTTVIKGQGAASQTDLDLVISNIDLLDAGKYTLNKMDVIEGFVSGATDASMYLPAIKAPSSPWTDFIIYDYTESQAHHFTIPNTTAYVATNTTVKRGLENLFSCGQLQLQGSYKIPKEYIAGISSPTSGIVQSIVGYYGDQGLSNIPYEYTISGYTIKNKKCFATYRNVHLIAVASGDTSIKQMHELKDSSDSATYPSVHIWSDMSSTGKPYARFKYLKDSPMQVSDAVAGLQWANAQLVLEGASGSLWNSLSTAFQNRSVETDKAFSDYSRQIGMKQTEISEAQINLGGQIGAISAAAKGNIIGAATTGASMELQLMQLQQQEKMNAGSYALEQRRLDQQKNENSIGLIKSNQVVAPSVNFTPEQNLGLYGYNYFVAYEVRKSDQDLISEDMYYQRFGYNGLHRPLTAQCFNERTYYCYVQAFDVNLKGTGSFGLRVRQKAIAQLNAGVRVWKVLPDASYYQTN